MKSKIFLDFDKANKVQITIVVDDNFGQYRSRFMSALVMPLAFKYQP